MQQRMRLCRALWRRAVDFGEKAVAQSPFPLGGVFLEVGKAFLHDQWQTVGMSLLSKFGSSQGMVSDE